jgi:hypothetical protein
MIATNASQFQLDLSKIIEKAKGNGSAVARKIALDLNTKVIEKTPRDEGIAKNRWAVALNTVDNAEYNADINGAGAVARGVGRLKDFKVGDTIYITNNVPYIRKLEYGLYGNPEGSANGPKTINGYSTQAPSGFVRITFQEIISQFPRIAASVIK